MTSRQRMVERAVTGAAPDLSPLGAGGERDPVRADAMNVPPRRRPPSGWRPRSIRANLRSPAASNAPRPHVRSPRLHPDRRRRPETLPRTPPRLGASGQHQASQQTRSQRPPQPRMARPERDTPTGTRTGWARLPTLRRAGHPHRHIVPITHCVELGIDPLDPDNCRAMYASCAGSVDAGRARRTTTPYVA